MAKSKVKSSTKAKAEAPAKVLTSIKEGRVTKPAQTPKAKAKEIAKNAVAKEEKSKKKKSKKAKTPTPEPESESEAESESSASSASSSDSESEAEVKKTPKINGKANGIAKVDKMYVDGSSAASSNDEESEDESESEAEAPVKKPKPVKVNGAAKAAADSSASESESDSSDSESSSDEEPTPAGGAKVAVEESSDSSDSSSESESDEEDAPKAKVAVPNGTAKATAASSYEDSDSASSDSDDSDAEAAASGSDASSEASSDSDEEAEQDEAPSKKRKAEEEAPKEVKKSKTDDAAEETVANIFVGNLSWNVDEEWLSREFEEFGEIVSCRIITDRATGRSKGFGYVDFASSESATKALAKQGAELDGRPLNVDLANKKENNNKFGGDRAQNRAKQFGDQRSPESDTLFVGNISFEASYEAVQEAFGEYGNVNSVRLPTDQESGALKGFGYVTFSSVEEAKNALENLSGYNLAGRPLRLDFATPRDNNGGSPRGGRGGRGGGRGGRGGFNDRGRGGRGGARGGRGNTTNRGGFGDFKGSRVTF